LSSDNRRHRISKRCRRASKLQKHHLLAGNRKFSHPAEKCWIIYPDLQPQYCDQEACIRKKSRHTAERCWILHPNLNPHKKSKSSVSSSSEEEDDDEDDEDDNDEEDEEVENNEEE